MKIRNSLISCWFMFTPALAEGASAWFFRENAKRQFYGPSFEPGETSAGHISTPLGSNAAGTVGGGTVGGGSVLLIGGYFESGALMSLPAGNGADVILGGSLSLITFLSSLATDSGSLVSIPIMGGNGIVEGAWEILALPSSPWLVTPGTLSIDYPSGWWGSEGAVTYWDVRPDSSQLWLISFIDPSSSGSILYTAINGQIPEPSGLILVGSGMMGLMVRRRREDLSVR